jgi:hypothetical protein
VRQLTASAGDEAGGIQRTVCEDGDVTHSVRPWVSADDKLEGKLKKIAEDSKLKKVNLAIQAPEGPAK